MKLTVLGCSTPFPRRDNPCSGYLVSGEQTAVLLDCGSGVFANLLDHMDPRDLTCVWISHMHPDHSADLVTFANWALNVENVPRIRVFGPEGWDRRLNNFLSDGTGDNLVHDLFDVGYIEDGATLELGELRLTGRLVHHSVTTYGVRISGSSSTFAYSGDTGVCHALEELAENVDLLLCEAGSDTPTEYHLTIQQARDIAFKANVGKLLITHVPYGANTTLAARIDDSLMEIVATNRAWLIGSSN